jgi:hypothetical protein
MTMLDGRFDLEFYKILAGQQFPDSEPVLEHQEVTVDPIVLRPWLVALVTVILLFVVQFA